MKFIAQLLQTYILSCSLLLLNAPIASAQSDSGSTPNTVAAAPTKLAAASDNDYTSSITMIAVGFIASRMYKYKFTTDILVAMAGGAAFIIGEVMSTNKFKETSKEMEIQAAASNASSATSDVSQTTSLETLKKSYQSAKEAAETKKKFQLAAAAAFGAAAAAALFMKGLEITSENSTTAALAASAATASAASAAASASCPTNGTTCHFIAPCAKAAASFSADVAERRAHYLKRDMTIAPSSALFTEDNATKAVFKGKVAATSATCPATSAVNAAVSADDVISQLGETFTANPTAFAIIKTQPHLNPNYFEKLLSIIFPSAQASMMNLLMGGAGAGAGILLSMVTSMGVTVDTFMFAPKNRAMIWGVLAGLAFMSSKASDNTSATLSENIAKIDKILAGMNTTASVTTAGTAGANAPNVQVKESNLSNITPQVNSNYAISKDVTQKTSCLGSSGEKNCSSIESIAVALPDYKLLPPGLQGMANNSLKLGDALSGTHSVSKSAQDIAGASAGNLKAIGKILAAQKSKLIPLLANTGRGNFDSAQNELLKNLNTNASHNMKENQTSPSRFLSSIGSILSTANASTAPSTNDKAAVKSADGVFPGGQSSEGFGSAPSNPFGTQLDKTLENSEEAKLNNENGEMKSGALDKFEVGTNDISTEKGASIFEVISSRYLKSGYKRLFKTIPE
jgi:hypothetical protein